MDIVLVLVLSAPLKLPLMFFKLFYFRRLASAENRIVQHEDVQGLHQRNEREVAPDYRLRRQIHPVSDISRDVYIT